MRLYVVVLWFFSISSAVADIGVDVLQKVQTCLACHRNDGNSLNEGWPNLAGQHAKYLEKQLLDYKSKKRSSPMMEPIASGLSADDIKQIARYFSSLKNSTPKNETKNETKNEPNNDMKNAESLSVGETLYRLGDFKKGIAACSACHSPTGLGNSSAGFPSLMSQPSAYTVAQLQAFKNKTRHNDMNDIMQDISHHMTQEDMLAVASYIQHLDNLS